MSILIQDLAQYKTSNNYELLAKQLKTHSIMCIIDYKFNQDEQSYVFREVGKTVYFEKNGQGTWQICCRGTSYLTAFSEEEFIKLCKLLHVEILEP